MPLTDSQKQRRAADKKAAKGLVRLCVWVTPHQKTEIRDYLAGKSAVVKIDPLNEYDGRVY